MAKPKDKGATRVAYPKKGGAKGKPVKASYNDNDGDERQTFPKGKRRGR